jgi:hypothetical protein
MFQKRDKTNVDACRIDSFSIVNLNYLYKVGSFSFPQQSIS